MEPSTVVIEEVAETEVVCFALCYFCHMFADVLAGVIVLSFIVAWPKVALNIARRQLPASFRPEEALLGLLCCMSVTCIAKCSHQARLSVYEMEVVQTMLL